MVKVITRYEANKGANMARMDWTIIDGNTVGIGLNGMFSELLLVSEFHHESDKLLELLRYNTKESKEVRRLGNLQTMFAQLPNLDAVQKEMLEKLNYPVEHGAHPNASDKDDSESCGTFKRLKRYNRSLIKIGRGGNYTGTWRKRKSKFLNLQDFGSKRFKSSRVSVPIRAGTQSNKCKVEHGKDNHSWINNVEGGDATAIEMQKPKTSKHFGKCIIFNNDKFPDDRQIILPNRDGSTQDLNQLRELFKKLNFDVIVKENLTAEEILQCMEDMGRLDHSQYRYFLCCVLTHGSGGQLYGSDGATVDVGDLVKCLEDKRCVSLKGKPKIFFLDASQVMDHQSETNDGFYPIPNVVDILLCYSTTPGCVAYRNDDGSIFISKLVGCIEKYHKECDLLSIMNRVTGEVYQEVLAEVNSKQVPAPFTTLCEKVYF